jgi:mono/diheme cytochrome c family protein
MKYLLACAISILLAAPAWAAEAPGDAGTIPDFINPLKLQSDTEQPDGKSPIRPAGLPQPASMAAPVQPGQTNALVWDSMNKEYKAAVGDTNTFLTFTATNTGPNQVVIRSVRPSCGCTIATMPANPWILPPGGSGSFKINTDLRGKRGALRKYIVIDSTEGYQLIHMTVILPEQRTPGNAPNTLRGRNLMVALADRQSVFKGSCVSCHVAPLAGKTGSDMYDAACGICHDVPNRASMVPDLYALKQPKSRDYWRKWTADGKEGTLMPAFAKSAGGPLDAKQIDDLVDYLVSGFTNVIANPTLRKGYSGAGMSAIPAK